MARTNPAHRVIGPVKSLEQRSFVIGGLPTNVSVMMLEPCCPAPLDGERHAKHISVEIRSAAARLQVSLAKRPQLKPSERGLMLGALAIDVAPGWEAVTICGHTYPLAGMGSRLSYEFTESGTLSAIVA